MELLKNMVLMISAYQVNSDLIKLLETVRLYGAKTTEIIIVNNDDVGRTSHYLDLAENKYNAHVLNQSVKEDEESNLKNAFKYTITNFSDYDGVITLYPDSDYIYEKIQTCVEAFYDNNKALVFGTRIHNKENRQKTSYTSSDDSIKTDIAVDTANTKTDLVVLPMSLLEEFVSIEGGNSEFESNIASLARDKQIKTVQVPIEKSYTNKSSSEAEAKNPIMKLIDYNKMLFRFIISAGTAFIIDNTIFTVVLALFSMETLLAITFSTAIARVASSAVNYLMNRYFVFKGSSSNSGIKYFSLVIVKLLASSLLVSFVNSILPFIHTTILKIMIDALLFLLSYAIQKRYIFGRRAQNE